MVKTSKNKHTKEKITTQTILEKMSFNFSRDAEWYKRTSKKIDSVKEELNKNFYTEEKKKQKLDFINKLYNKLKDYKDAVKYEGRYKKVRFVERRKLERKLKQIQKKISEYKGNKEEDMFKALQKEESEVINDINYVKYYPKSYKYYSWFPNNDKDNKEMIEKREKMKRKVQFYMNTKNKKEDDEDDDVMDIDKNENNKNSKEKGNEEGDEDENDDEGKEKIGEKKIEVNDDNKKKEKIKKEKEKETMKSRVTQREFDYEGEVKKRRNLKTISLN